MDRSQPLALLWGCHNVSFCPSPSGQGWAAAGSRDGDGGSRDGDGRASPGRLLGPAAGWARATSYCSVSRAAPHEVFIGSVMLFPCQTITEIGSVCVIGERILMAQFPRCGNGVDAPSPVPSVRSIFPTAERREGVAAPGARLGLRGLGQVLEVGTSARRSSPVPAGTCCLAPAPTAPKLQGRWCLPSAPDETPGSSPDPGDPPPGADLPRQLRLGAGVGTKQTEFKGQGPFSSDFCVLNSKAIFRMIRKGQFGIF